MGVEPFLLSSSLVAVLAQRLVRMLCDYCKTPNTASPGDCALMGVDATNPPTVYRAVGCSECNQLGYRGRTGIYELVEIDDEIRTLIHDGAGEQRLEAHARKHSQSMRQDGWRRVLAGTTTLEEVLRVSRED
jgi:general secretion pathway protein E